MKTIRKVTQIFILFFWLFNSSSQANQEIVGGEDINDINAPEFKYTVRLLIRQEFDPNDAPSLRGRKFSLSCSGVFIGQGKIVTAAHCFPPFIEAPVDGVVKKINLINREVEIFSWYRAGSPEFSGLKTSKFNIHPDYEYGWQNNVKNVWNPSVPINDIAVVKFQGTLPFNKAPISLDNSPLTSINNQSFNLSGFGKSNRSQIQIPQLRRVSLPLLNTLRNGSDVAVGRGSFQTPTDLPHPQGGCIGDSGGPVVLGGKLVGVISRGPGPENGGCFAGVTIFTSIYSSLNWINDTF
jgi:secreted trypsin-like serine protease